MAASYPTSAKSFTAVTDGDTVTDEMFEEAYDEITAVETALLTGGLAHHLFPDATANDRDLGKTTTKWRDLYLSDQIYERARTVALGEWTSPSFSAGDFTASGSMTWTVAEADVTTYAYALVGKMMTVSLVLVNTTVAGTPDTFLKVAIPGGHTATKHMQTAAFAFDNSARVAAAVRVTAASTVIEIELADGSNWAASTDATRVYAQLTFEVD